MRLIPNEFYKERAAVPIGLNMTDERSTNPHHVDWMKEGELLNSDG
ncbi:hypothetical protein [Membranihabitans marinus]|nr:hypothetical protein [Membranihabitans marinus]